MRCGGASWQRWQVYVGGLARGRGGASRRMAVIVSAPRSLRAALALFSHAREFF
jgi:hypothetical protein